MAHRSTTWWRALGVVLLGLATATWPQAARAESSAQFEVLHQNAVAALSSTGLSSFTTTVALRPAGVAASAQVSLYPALVTRSALDDAVDGEDQAAPLATTKTMNLTCERHGRATFSVAIATAPHRLTNSSCGSEPRLRFACPSAGCGGVYPVRFRVRVDGAVITKWSLLALRSETVAKPLAVNLVETFGPPALRHPLRSRRVLTMLKRFANSPVTLGVNYDALADLEVGPDASAWRKALRGAVASSLHSAVVAPSSDVDFAGLVANGLTTQVAQQLALSAHLFQNLTGRYVDGPVVLTGRQSAADLLALGAASVDDVVLPEGDLAQAPSSTLTWGAPFRVAGATALSALSDDGPLTSLVADGAIEPGRRAAITLATLAFLHFEAPNAPSTRSVVIDSAIGATAPTFLADLYAGLDNDPFSDLEPLTPSFDSSLVGSNGAPSTRQLTYVAPATWSPRNVTSLLTLIGDVTSFSLGAKSNVVTTRLRVAVARAEVTGSPGARQNAITEATRLLDVQLSRFSIDSSSITLAGAGSSLPITVISHAPYDVDAVVHLVTDRLHFPKGAAVPVTLNSSTQSVRVPATDPRGSSLTLQVLLTTPNSQVVLARTAIQVRIAGASLVGYLLTFASVFVLALWWWRTSRRRTRGRHRR